MTPLLGLAFFTSAISRMGDYLKANPGSREAAAYRPAADQFRSKRLGLCPGDVQRFAATIVLRVVGMGRLIRRDRRISWKGCLVAVRAKPQAVLSPVDRRGGSITATPT